MAAEINDISSPGNIFESLSASLDSKEGDQLDNKDNDEIPLKDNENDENEEEIITKGEKDEDDEEIDSKLDLDEKDEDELELSKIPTRAQIKAKYPDIFKDFKALDKIFYREKAFAEVFPTVKDAKAAREAISDYNALQADLLNGDITGILAQVKQSDEKAFEKITSSILEQLNKVDKNAYVEPTRMILKNTLSNLYTIAKNTLKKDGDNKRAQQLEIAVELLHEAIFNESEVTPYAQRQMLQQEKDPEKEKFEKERNEFQQRKFQTAHGHVTTKFNDLVVKAIEKNIDVRNVLPAYVKGKLIEDVRQELDKQLIADQRFGGIIKKLYERAREGDYSQGALDNILTALKNKAGSILPEIMRAKKGEALKGLGKRSAPRELSREKSGEDDELTDATTRSSRSRSERKDNSNESGPRPGESALEYLDRKLG